MAVFGRCVRPCSQAELGWLTVVPFPPAAFVQQGCELNLLTFLEREAAWLTSR